MRRVKPTPKVSDSRWPVRLRITGYTNSTTVTVMTVGEYNGLLAGEAIVQWAFAVTNLSGLTWLEGATDIRVNGDGGDYGPFTVTGGQLVPALPEPVARGWVGRPYSMQLRTLPPNQGEASGAARGALKRIDKIMVMVDGAAAGWVRRVGTKEAGVSIAGRLAEHFIGQTPPASEDDVWEELPGGFDHGGQLEFVNDTSLPSGIAGFVFRMVTNA